MKIATITCVGLLALASACSSQPKPDNSINIVVGPDGKVTVVAPKGGAAEDQAAAAILSAALNGQFDDEPTIEPATDEKVWLKDAEGNLTHRLTGATCPAVWGTFQRGKVTVFKPDGTDVGCNYVLAGSTTFMTFYVFQSAKGLDAEMQEAINAMKTRQPVSKETPFLAPSGNNSYTTYALAYSAADGVKMRTSVLFGQVGTWLLEVRLTCTDKDALETERLAGLALTGQTDRLRSPQPPQASPKPPI
ncbi:MAG TPA: hypothetical protein VG942_16275 [Hyphomonadaceae bacterium]|nr:hypothetical protein [Hyphomonadaceae bacterium]